MCPSGRSAGVTGVNRHQANYLNPLFLSSAPPSPCGPLWQAPPIRLCLLGPRGSGRTHCARTLAENFGVFHIQFDEFLQEKMLLKAERKFGPEFEDDSEEEQATKQELEELAVQANVKIEEESTKKQVTWWCPWGALCLLRKLVCSRRFRAKFELQQPPQARLSYRPRMPARETCLLQSCAQIEGSGDPPRSSLGS